MGEIGIGQMDFLIKTLREQRCLEIFKLEDKKMLWDRFEDLTIGQKGLIHHLIIKNQDDRLVNVLDQFGIERK